MVMLSALLAILPLLASMSVSGAPVKREVPQEHSHEQFITTVRASLALNNPNAIQDPIFGLLGNAAASAGQGKITNTDCLQQATADQAFTNAKAAGDVTGMTAALVFRALERNTVKVGLASVLCTETAVNPEIAAISQHQDPASAGAAATNKGITLALAKQIAAIGGDPQTALKSGTFAPGSLDDNSGKGNTCDNADDPVGCIFTQNLLVEDATAAEITAAVAGVAVAAPAAGGVAVADPAAVLPACGAESVAAPVATTAAAAPAATTAVAAAPAGGNAAAGGISVGACTNPQMVFAAGIDGRKATESAFQPADLTNFNHGSALNPLIISQFMCDTFVNACGKSKSTQTACQGVKSTIDAQLAAGTLKKDQSYADAWINGLVAAGFPNTGGAAAAPAAGGNNAATPAATTAAAAPVVAVPAATAAPAAAAPAPATGGGASGGAAGTNVQTFTGALNGVSAPAVIKSAGDRPFSVNGNTFVNAAAALQRSCAIQNNGCSNAANSGKGTSLVGECGAQEKACNAAA